MYRPIFLRNDDSLRESDDYHSRSPRFTLGCKKEYSTIEHLYEALDYPYRRYSLRLTPIPDAPRSSLKPAKSVALMGRIQCTLLQSLNTRAASGAPESPVPGLRTCCWIIITHETSPNPRGTSRNTRSPGLLKLINEGCS